MCAPLNKSSCVNYLSQYGSNPPRFTFPQNSQTKVNSYIMCAYACAIIRGSMINGLPLVTMLCAVVNISQARTHGFMSV